MYELLFRIYPYYFSCGIWLSLLNFWLTHFCFCHKFYEFTVKKGKLNWKEMRHVIGCVFYDAIDTAFNLGWLPWFYIYFSYKLSLCDVGFVLVCIGWWVMYNVYFKTCLASIMFNFRLSLAKSGDCNVYYHFRGFYED